MRRALSLSLYSFFVLAISQPTLNPRRMSRRSRDVVWVNVWSVRWGGGVGRGDVVILHSPTHPGEVLVKRVVGEEGETVETKGYRTRRIVVPPGHSWVEGDNLRASRDSNLFGPVSPFSILPLSLSFNFLPKPPKVSKGLIFGRGSHIVWPPQRWRRLNSDLLPQQRARVSPLPSYTP